MDNDEQKTNLNHMVWKILFKINKNAQASPVQTSNQGFAPGLHWGLPSPNYDSTQAGSGRCKNTPQLRSTHHVVIYTFGNVS